MRMLPKNTLTLLIALLVCGSFHFAKAAVPTKSLDAEFSALQEFYTIDESQPPDIQNVQKMSFSILAFQTLADNIRELALNLLSWTLHPEAPQIPTDRYNRRNHFGRWVNDPKDDTCYNTRAKVLMRDADGPIVYKDSNHCIVEKGIWEDPYSGRTYTESKDIQIDHMVPLKDAYLSGAWEWNFQARCLYANFMGNNFHLIAANGTENMRKGDRAPDAYMPPNPTYRCQYLENWLKIKLIWKLKMTPSEVSAIRQGIKDNDCDPRNFSLTSQDLKNQRELINDNLDLCPAH